MVDFVAYNDADKAILTQLEAFRPQIDASIPNLNWNRKEGKKESAVELLRKDFDPNVREQWPDQHAWMLQSLEALHRAFAPLIKNL